MVRTLYLGSLALLQIALLRDVLPVLGAALQRAAPLGSTSGVSGAAILACAVAAVVGVTLVLGFPTLALMRHVQRGEARFAGLPRWAVLLAVGGALLGLTALGAVCAHDAFGWPAATLPWSAVEVAGVGLLAGASVAAECLRRSVPTTRRVLTAREHGPRAERERSRREPFVMGPTQP